MEHPLAALNLLLTVENVPSFIKIALLNDVYQEQLRRHRPTTTTESSEDGAFLGVALLLESAGVETRRSARRGLPALATMQDAGVEDVTSEPSTEHHQHQESSPPDDTEESEYVSSILSRSPVRLRHHHRDRPLSLEERIGGLDVPTDEGRLRRIFGSYDVDCNGFISRREFRDQYREFEWQLGIPSTERETDRLFDSFDHARDGRLHFEEFSLLMLHRAKY